MEMRRITWEWEMLMEVWDQEAAAVAGRRKQSFDSME